MPKKRIRKRYNLASAKHQAAMIDMMATFIAGVMVRAFVKSNNKHKDKQKRSLAQPKRKQQKGR